MLDRIAILMDSLRQVTTDVAHDLRSPLSRLYQRLEDARTHARSMADYEAAIDAALGAAQGLLETFPPYCGSLRWKGHRRAPGSPMSTSPL
jgi:signal transduction histidine kinase